MNNRLNKFLKDPLSIRTLVCIVIALALMGINMLICGYVRVDPILSGIITICAYILIMCLIGIIYKLVFIKISDPSESEITPLLGGMTLDLMVQLKMPVLLCNDDGKIIWHNRVFGALAASRTNLYGKNFSTICSAPLSDIMTQDDNSDGVLAAVFNRFYKISGYRIISHNKKYCITVWNDQTELNEAYEKLKNNDPVIAYIMIDNLDELLQYVQEKYREVSLEISSLLKSWSDSVGGVLKEYERDKFLFVMRDADLQSFIDDKFGIIDSVHNIRVGDSNLPVTISVGIARIEGSLADKEKAAQSALDMALQRGGDQVVIKNPTDLEFFGGKNKSVQKRTRVRSRVVANELIMHISQSSNVLVMGHVNADFDSLGACIGIFKLSGFCDVPCNIVINTKNPGLSKCFEKLEPLDEYRTVFLDAAEAQEYVQSDTLLVIVDVNNCTQYEAPDIEYSVSKMVIIDHHRKTEEFKNNPVISYIEPSASSTCEIVSEILEQTLPEGTLSKDEADIMFAGISLDTKQFTRNAGTRTFSAALYLRSEGASPGDAQKLFNTNLDEFIREAKFESNVIIYRSVIAISVNEAPNNTISDRIAAAKAADKLLTVEGVMASFALCKIDDVIHISARSAGTINVQLILEKLDGGGHFDAAATQVTGSTMADALTRLKASIDEYITSTN